jgi:hypothetical protein
MRIAVVVGAAAIGPGLTSRAIPHTRAARAKYHSRNGRLMAIGAQRREIGKAASIGAIQFPPSFG